jgi:hypothetical protein
VTVIDDVLALAGRRSRFPRAVVSKKKRAVVASSGITAPSA